MDELKTVLSGAGLALPETVLEDLTRYQALLTEWNARMDLTSVSQQETAHRHFVDSLLPLREEGLFPAGCRVIDVGSGAGFPGLPLAIARRDMQFTLLEAQGKRCQFLQAVCDALRLENVRVIQNRAEVLGREEGHREGYDRAVARAVAPLSILCEYLLPFVKTGGSALCWKGPAVQEEWEDGQFAAQALGGGECRLIQIPGTDTSHVIVEIPKKEKTIPLYPRKNGIPAKRPLKADKK